MAFNLQDASGSGQHLSVWSPGWFFFAVLEGYREQAAAQKGSSKT